jgi:predicted HTH transcriptional regulator
MKTIAAFLNSRGGRCVIGVDDRRRPIGLERDYKTLQRKDRDGFEIHFTQMLNAMIGPEFRSLVKLKFETLDGADVCSIEVKPSPRPVYFKHDEHEYFYMRTGNITTSLKLSEIESYVRGRWPSQLSR